jgi:hypothetical protein
MLDKVFNTARIQPTERLSLFFLIIITNYKNLKYSKRGRKIPPLEPITPP